MTIKPRLQLALDHTRLDAALHTVDRLHPYVDIIEAGTILCISAGIQAVSTLRERCPQHTLVADSEGGRCRSYPGRTGFFAGSQLDDRDMRSPPGHHG